MNKTRYQYLFLLAALILSSLMIGSVQSVSGSAQNETICDAAQFVSDVTVADKTPFAPNAAFKKVWRLKNVGSCTWSEKYQLVYISGNRLGAVQSKAIGRSVAPGETIDLGIDMVAPSETGKHNSYWMLQNESGKQFGIGDQARDVFWVQILVQNTTASTPVPAPTPTTLVPTTPPNPDLLCNHAFFLADVTIPDGTKLQPGQKFTKTWRLKNIGSCAWSTGYQLVYSGGESFGAPASVAIPRAVQPGEQVELSLSMAAPLQAGTYNSYWKLRSPGNGDFGIGVKGDRAFWAKIQVTSSAPILTPVATATPGAYPTPVSGTPCDKIGAVKDVTVPDLTEFLPWDTFVKTWRLTNGGTCTWSTGYKLVYHSGNDFKAKKSISLPKSVKPGESIDISLTMTAPSEANDYIGYWKLQNEKGEQFGVGTKANGVFWVKIRVINYLREPFALYKVYCQAVWTTSKGALTRCPSKSEDFTNGSVTLDYNPQIEGGSHRRDQPTLITIPSDGSGGFIQAVFPPYYVQGDDRFTTTFGCMNDADGCDVRFKFGYLDSKGAYFDLLPSERQLNDANTHVVEMKLDKLQGKPIQFVLRVENNGSSNGDRAFWLYPTVWRDR